MSELINTDIIIPILRPLGELLRLAFLRTYLNKYFSSYSSFAYKSSPGLHLLDTTFNFGPFLQQLLNADMTH